MLIQDGNNFIETDREWKLGSLIHFNINSMSDLDLASLTELQKSRLEVLLHYAKQVDDKVISKAEMAKLLELSLPTATRLLQAFVEKGVLRKIENFKHHSNRSNIFAYEFEPLVKELPTAVVIQEASTNHNNIYQQEVALAKRYSHTVDVQADDFHAFEERKILDAFLGASGQLSFSNFLGADGDNTRSLERRLQTIDKDGKRLIATAKLESDLSCLEVSDTRFIYALLNLTITYHLAHGDLYSKNGQSSIKNITPIARDDLMTWLRLSKNEPNRKFVHDKLHQVENNKFSLELTAEDEEFVHQNKRGKRLFQIVESDARVRKTKANIAAPLPYRYFIKWDTNVLKQMFSTNSLFIFPVEVIQQPFTVFMLYVQTRIVLSKRQKVVYDLDKLASLINFTDPDRSPAIKMLWRDFKKAFPDNATEVRAGRSARSKLVSVRATGSVGGCKFTVIGDKFSSRKPIMQVTIEACEKNILALSQPEKIRKQLMAGGEFDFSKLEALGRGSKSAVKFSNTLPLVASRVEDDNYVQTSPEQPLLKALQLEAKPFVLRKRKYTLIVEASHSKYVFHRYMTEDDYSGMIADVAKLTGNDTGTVLNRVAPAFKSLHLFLLDRKLPLTPKQLRSLLSEIETGSKVEIELSALIQRFQLRARGLACIDADDTDTLKEYIINLI
ncbi:hypothetical protein K6Y31_21005 [Motilimonas cestriensis]|uniref:Replication initiator protein RctB central region domain-containing protein n=1 Tax=Motilimonas cestriensis TaxID=2742685 RepID=A0ABS8WFX9_9GAMM|nr:replication initiator protein RctB domain-containing protein [Motilimonas cestriensis]MCE2597257.1 hypothetical protein [Motilimonas cestriensis]